MSVTMISYPHPSTDGVHTLAGVAAIPSGRARAILHIVHGMTEHISRYTPTMRALAEAGILCVGYDNLGHGYTAKAGEHGFIASRDGHALLARDVAAFATAVKARLGADLPYVLMGHSMGSFIVRLAAATTFRPDKLILMGTGGKNPLAGVALGLIALVRRIYGERHVSTFIDKLAIGNYNDRFRGEGNERNLWLTTDASVRKKYAADPLCAYMFSVGGYAALTDLTAEVVTPTCADGVPKDLPLLYVAGSQDPVGDFGKGVRAAADLMIKAGVDDVTTIMYLGMRHEILNEPDKAQVYDDVLNWIEGRL
jgi:alpha-beta hydrolase superfamily lysophospholipase